MTEPAYDIVIRGGRVATASDVFEADVAIAGETVAAIGRDLPAGKREIDARGKVYLDKVRPEGSPEPEVAPQSGASDRDREPRGDRPSGDADGDRRRRERPRR